MTTGSSAARGDVLVLLGTRKGGFIISGGQNRKDWAIDGPYFPGSEVFHLVYDQRDGGSVFGAVNHVVWGPQIQLSRDLGGTWQEPNEQPRFAGSEGRTVERLWHIKPGRIAEPGVMYAGVQPAALFKSEDDGNSWHEVTALTEHSTRELWQPGLGGLCLHSIVLDESHTDRAWVGISAVGVFGIDDGGNTWQTMNQGIRADFLPDPFPEFGQCPGS